MASNKTTREMAGGLIAVKINEKLKRQNIRDKNGILLSITKSQVLEFHPMSIEGFLFVI